MCAAVWVATVPKLVWGFAWSAWHNVASLQVSLNKKLSTLDRLCSCLLGSSPLRVAPFPRQGVLICLRVEKSNWDKQTSMNSSMNFSLLSSAIWLAVWSSYPGFPIEMDYNLDYKMSNSFSSKLLFVRIFYHSLRSETRTPGNYLKAPKTQNTEINYTLIQCNVIYRWKRYLFPHKTDESHLS